MLKPSTLSQLRLLAMPHCLAWILFSCGWTYLSIFVMNDGKFTNRYLASFYFTYGCVGFLLSFGLAAGLRWLQANNKISGWRIYASVVLASMAGGLVHHVSGRLMDQLIWGMNIPTWAGKWSLHAVLLETTLFCAVLVFSFWMYNQHDLQKTREAAAKAVEAAQRMRLQMLRYQLNPHFLYNSLNAIRSMIRENPAKARDMVTAHCGHTSKLFTCVG